MEKIAYFVSDAHLGIDPNGCIPQRESLLIECLESWKENASHVVIVGDLFEFWYEYKYYVVRSHFELFRAFSDLVNAGVQVHLIRGNHDFAYGDYFPKALGVQVHSKLHLDIQGKKIFVQHGDGVAKSDFGYRMLRRILDFPVNRKLFQMLHPDWGMALARFVGRNSRKIGESREIRLNEYLNWGNRMLQQGPFDFCIHGHHHIAGIWDTENGKVASAGEWIWNPSYLMLKEGELSLQKVIP
ncbi:MAG: UDP-2,3-diacylglucosamine diphosphatase [Fibrobacteraceae bacterium]|nr:UDP-2,3-diacylglucosamine diphosphatase [Fibrobacteraceae bacterium]